MEVMGVTGRAFIAAGILLVIVGLVLNFGGRLPIRLGRMPGDFVWRGKNSVVYFPLATCILISAVGSLLLWLMNRMR